MKCREHAQPLQMRQRITYFFITDSFESAVLLIIHAADASVKFIHKFYALLTAVLLLFLTMRCDAYQ